LDNRRWSAPVDTAFYVSRSCPRIDHRQKARLKALEDENARLRRRLAETLPRSSARRHDDIDADRPVSAETPPSATRAMID
jgi:hypothetical protein